MQPHLPWTQGHDLLDFVNDPYRSSSLPVFLCPICPAPLTLPSPLTSGFPQILIFIFIQKAKDSGRPWGQTPAPYPAGLPSKGSSDSHRHVLGQPQPPLGTQVTLQEGLSSDRSTEPSRIIESGETQAWPEEQLDHPVGPSLRRMESGLSPALFSCYPLFLKTHFQSLSGLTSIQSFLFHPFST